jgi:hypothetical protein
MLVAIAAAPVKIELVKKSRPGKNIRPDVLAASGVSC